uniref:[histone H3]-trimethyl-L-lysine(9) demethylase n=1 Tax=Astyanax mexicanus TaxID=7994 RepID=A0A8B9LP11_ASTMX
MASDSVAPNPAFRIMTFHPTKEEFKDFSRYIAYMESKGAHRAGIAKIIPPKDWKPRRTYDDIDDLIIPAPIQQVVTGQSGLFTQYNIQKKPMSVREFRKVSNTEKFSRPRHADFEELERKYWKNLTFNPPLYGADVNGTLYDPDVMEWNIGHLNTILDTVEKESGIKIKGVNTPYLYFGMWKSTFAWHTEDMDLYSINYLHFGEPKSWYVVPPENGKRLERLAKGFFPGSAQSCEAFLRHKMTLISPSILRKYGIHLEKVTQEAGQFIVTFPYAYHSGFNHGFNCAEATNFATLRWIDYGKQAALCSCRKDMVKISMDLFVRKFQPERFKLWKAGKDNAPIDHSKPTPESAEFLQGGKPEAERGELSNSSTTEGVVEEREKGETEKRMERADKGKESDNRETDKEQSGEAEKNEGREEETSEKAKAENGETEAGEMETEKDTDREDIKDEVNKESKNTVSELQDLEENTAKEEGKIKEENNIGELASENGESEGHTTKQELDIAEMKPEEEMKNERSERDSSMIEEASSELNTGKEKAESESCELVRGKTNEEEGRKMETGNEKDETGTEREDKETKEEEKNKEEREETDEHGEEEKRKKKNNEKPSSSTAQERSVYLCVCVCVFVCTELQEQAGVEEDWLEGESWAKPLAQLWQNRPYNEEREREYNREMGLQPPYCAVCMLFQTYLRVNSTASQRSEGGDVEVVRAGGQMRTKPMIPEMCFSTTTEENAELALSTPYLEQDGTSLLITCSQCCVRCSSVLPCVFCVCFFRWVHVLCAVAVLEARFVNIAERSPVDLSGIPLQRFKLKCYYCKRRMKKPSGCCVQCSHGRCPTSYHPTCAQAAGVLMHPDDWPFVVYVTCCRHKGPVHLERNKETMRELSVGQKVICKHKNGRYYQCDVIQLSKETFYEVNFDDGSFSDNLFPEDIVSRDCSQLGPPPSGEVVQVRWTDGLTYGAKFVAAHVTQMYQVEFEDGSQLPAKRDDVYTLDEELPKRVKSRLSKASDMRFDEMFGEKKVQDSKRQRVINSRYRGDYIEPVIYRAIME